MTVRLVGNDEEGYRWVPTEGDIAQWRNRNSPPSTNRASTNRDRHKNVLERIQRYATVLDMRWSGKTLKECGAAVGVSRERARQMEAQAARKLLQQLNNQSFKITII